MLQINQNSNNKNISFGAELSLARNIENYLEILKIRHPKSTVAAEIGKFRKLLTGDKRNLTVLMERDTFTQKRNYMFEDFQSLINEKDADPLTRYSVTRMVGDVNIVPQLRDKLIVGYANNADAYIKAGAAHELGKLSDPNEAVELIKKLIKDSDDNVKINAVSAIRNLPAKAQTALIQELKSAPDTNPNVKLWIANLERLMTRVPHKGEGIGYQLTVLDEKQDKIGVQWVPDTVGRDVLAKLFEFAYKRIVSEPKPVPKPVSKSRITAKAS